ncbi:transmembrane protein 220 [Plakobranchus ocellatus]|uniref:Transmembrane protein 220 n=1 Tax=Plakobranchus ocellatus TaxID=259542 RepID=A0AAV3Y7K2_9GAST|nr:transmembrane protein 220 [Plakobranchus ocellatus]
MSQEIKEKSTQIWRTVHFLFAIFFSLACFVNRNDADWYLWMPIYSVPALLCFTASIKPHLRGEVLWHAAANILFYGCLLYWLFEVFAVYMVYRSKGITNPFAFEEGRELGGLTIIVAWARISLSSTTERSSDKSSKSSIVTLLPWIMTSLAVIPLAFWSLCFIPNLGLTFEHCNSMKSC